MDSIEIKTERLVLKPLGTKYLESTVTYATDYENAKYMCWLPNDTAAETEAFLVNVEKEWQKETPDFLEFAVIWHRQHIGAVSVYYENDTAEIGWIIQKQYWGNGFAYEAAAALIAYTMSARGTRHFLAHCDTRNIASYRVMEKLGMTKTGEWGGRRNRAAAEDSYEYQYELHLPDHKKQNRQNSNRE